MTLREEIAKELCLLEGWKWNSLKEVRTNMMDHETKSDYLRRAVACEDSQSSPIFVQQRYKVVGRGAAPMATGGEMKDKTLIIVIINLLFLLINVKLYTEIFKERVISLRK